MSAITLGIVGGGQLGRMSAMAAKKLGISCVIYTPDENTPGAQVASDTVVAAYDDESSLEKFADKVDFITYEFENIPVTTVRYLKRSKPVYPDERLLEIAQDRVIEKSFLNEIGIKTTRWILVNAPEDIDKALEEWGTTSGILKTTRFGYDGKGQAWVHEGDSAATVLEQFNGQPVILEEPVDFACEISVIVCRDQSGAIEVYGPILNEHKNHILDRSIYPAPIENVLSMQAIETAKSLAQEVDLIGVLTLEMFVTKNGDILANEIAPRTHNSGHWSIDACAVSQFENHVRAVCGMSVSDPAPHAQAEMLNLIGNDIEKINDYADQENAHVHLYGKEEARAGRKMGHVTFLNTPSPSN